ncbi:hypothetical protein F5B20DRAFT_573884 [Whalleya microplaca]|nr:hypothetical protein F5B20DRAFT_573884 [Whalleya microplaca]
MTMLKRRSHKKSRRGCQNCKQWHVKCDEQGPPCTNCDLRKAECVYSWMKPKQTQNSLSIRPRQTQSRSHSPVERPQGSVVSICAPYGGPTRLLELELMHLWSTTAFKDLCCIPEDGPYMQSILPREALRYDFMMDCIFAMSAVQIASHVEEEAKAKTYVNAAIQFFNRGSNSFRTQLSNLNAENCHIVYMFSAITVSVNIAIHHLTHMDGSMLTLMRIAFDLLNGSSSIALASAEWIYDSPAPVRLLVGRVGASKNFIDPDTREALSRLSRFNDQKYKPCDEIVNDTEEEEPSRIRIGGYDTSSEYDLYRKAIASLQLCFAEEGRGLLKNFSSAFPSLAGPAFSTAFRESRPFALLIVMHWAVMVSKFDSVFAWWSAIGPNTAMEILDLLQKVHPTLVLEWEDSISWVLENIGLPPLRQRLLEL